MNVDGILRSKGSSVVTAGPDVPVSEVVRRLRDYRIGAVVVISDGGRVEGILSERDIVCGLAEHGAAALGQSSAELMSRDIATCTPTDSVGDLMAVMTAGRFRHVPVMDGGTLVGIISIGDVVKWRVEEMESEAEALRSYVTQG